MDKSLTSGLFSEATAKAIKDHLANRDELPDPPRYFIGVDPYDEPAPVYSYCLTRHFQGNQEVVLMKTLSAESTTKDEFMEEVRNLAKYFNANLAYYQYEDNE